jgi:hypothetical protein
VSVLVDQETFTYPRYLLADCESGLLLFCSGRMGMADGHWFREAALEDVTCVDWDEKTLWPFAALYPDWWLYLQADVFEWVETQGGSAWEIVSADMPSQYANRLTEMLPKFCALSEKYVTVTMACYTSDDPIQPPAPEGWRYVGDPIWRSEFEGRRFWWLVLEKA